MILFVAFLFWGGLFTLFFISPLHGIGMLVAALAIMAGGSFNR